MKESIYTLFPTTAYKDRFEVQVDRNRYNYGANGEIVSVEGERVDIEVIFTGTIVECESAVRLHQMGVTLQNKLR